MSSVLTWRLSAFVEFGQQELNRARPVPGNELLIVGKGAARGGASDVKAASAAPFCGSAMYGYGGEQGISRAVLLEGLLNVNRNGPVTSIHRPLQWHSGKRSS